MVVKEGKKVLDSADYTVSNERDGKTVESMVEPDEYTIVVSFPGTSKKDVEIAFKVGKAGIKSFKAVKDVYAYTGEAVKPDFNRLYWRQPYRRCYRTAECGRGCELREGPHRCQRQPVEED